MDKEIASALKALKPQQHEELVDLFLYRTILYLCEEICDNDFRKTITKTLREHGKKKYGDFESGR